MRSRQDAEAEDKSQREDRRRQLIHNLHPSMFSMVPQTTTISWRQRVYRTLEKPQGSGGGMVLLGVLLLCVVLSILAYFFKSEPEWRDHPLIEYTEFACTIVFTIELCVRIVVGTLDPWALIVKDITLYIDLASVTPFYLERALFSGASASAGSQDAAGDDNELPVLVQVLQLLRLLRVLKLLRHYSGWRVLTIALERSWRAVAVPVFAMMLVVLLLSGLLFAVEASSYGGSGGEPLDADRPEPLANAFESMWAVFWVVTTLGFDGHMGSEQAASRLVFALAIVCGLLLTTMPITVLGGAFASAWEQKEVVEVAMKVQELLVEHGHSARDVQLVFDAFDTSGDGALDWPEFKKAMRVLKINLPLLKMRRLFTLFDSDESGTIDHDEFCRLLFPAGSSVTTEESPNGGGGGDGGVDGEFDDAPACAKAARRRSSGGGGAEAGGRGGGNWRQAVGAVSWHDFRGNPNARRLLNPMLIAADQVLAKDKVRSGGGGAADKRRRKRSSQLFGGKMSQVGVEGPVQGVDEAGQATGTGGGDGNQDGDNGRDSNQVAPVAPSPDLDGSQAEQISSAGASGRATPDSLPPLKGAHYGANPAPRQRYPLPDLPPHVSASAAADKTHDDEELRAMSRRLERLEGTMQRMLDLLEQKTASST